MTRPFTLGMAQMLVVGGQPDENLARAVQMIREAAERGCDVVLLPECLDLGWTHPSALDLAEPIPGPRSERLAEAARAAGVHVVAGLTERANGRSYNASVLISPTGDILLRHRKLNELDIARPYYAMGDSVAVAETAFGVVGIPICADNFAESAAIGQAMGLMGADFILSPCSWAVDADYDHERLPYHEQGTWTVPYTRLAKEFGMTVVGVSNVGRLDAGPWAGRKCIGNSLAVGDGGRVLATGRYGEQAEELIAVSLPSRAAPQGSHGPGGAEVGIAPRHGRI